MENLDSIFNENFTPNIVKKQQGNTFFLIDKLTGVLLSQNNCVITFQDEEGKKFIYVINSVDLKAEISHFLALNEDGDYSTGNISFCLYKEEILQKTYNYFSKYIDHRGWNKWTINLN